MKTEHTVMAAKGELILQKISFLEKDIELHKQILVSIPEGREEEMEKVIRTIAELKGKVEELKASIAEVDPEMFDQVRKLEKATAEFSRLAAEKQFETVVTLDHSHECFLDLTDGSRLECLVKARERSGDWLVLTLGGEVRQVEKKDLQDE